MNAFLNNYKEENASNHEIILEESIMKLPFTLSFPIKKAKSAIDEQQYEKAMNRILDFFEISIPFISFIFLRLLSELFRSNYQVQVTLEDFVNRIDKKRPLSMGDWLNDLFNPLFFTIIQFLPGNILSQSFRKNLLEGNQNILSGYKSTRSIVQIRNNYKHGMSLSEEIYKDVVIELKPLFMRMLYALYPLTNCRYDIREGKYEIFCDSPNGWGIDLFPLVFVNSQDHRYVFQTLKSEQTCFISSNENADILVTYDMNNEIDKDLQRFLPSFDISKKLNWEEIKKSVQKISSRYLSKMKNEEKKYNPELFVEREKLTKTLHCFWESKAALFPLLGSAGRGKTNQLCYWAEKLLAEDKSVLVFNSSDFTDKNLESVLKDIFGQSKHKDIVRLLDDIHDKAMKQKQIVYLFFDAINECLKYAEASDKVGSLSLYLDIRRLLCQERYTNFKTLLTCREYTWKNCILPFIKDDDSLLFHSEEEGCVVRGFNLEETERAYCIYQQMHQMLTPFKKLDRRVTLRIKDPLILRFVSENYRNKELSSDPMQFTSLSLFEQTMNYIEFSKAGHHQRLILERMADYMLKSYIKGVPMDGIPYDELRDSFSDTSSELHSLAEIIFLNKDGETTTAFNEVVGNKDRPILRKVSRADSYGKRDYIQFVYERFLEYAMGDALVRMGHKDFNSDQPLSASFFANFLKEGTPNVVFMGTMRNALLIDCMRVSNFNTLIDLEKQWGEDYVILSLVTEVINTMIRENYEDELFKLINNLLDYSNDKQQEIDAFNKVVLTIESNKADEKTMLDYKLLSQQLAQTIRMKKLASVSTINGILLTDFFNEQLYEHDALALLWKIMLDPFDEIRNDACMYTYYLSNRKYTLDFTPLEENLTVHIVKKMYGNVKTRSLLRNIILKTNRSKTMMYVETASRLCVLMIIDHLRNNDENSPQIVSEMIDELKDAFRYLTGNLVFLRLFMPIFQIAMKKQITFQSDYVNNAIEYQTSWVQDTFKGNEYQGVSWKHADVNELMSFAYHYHHFGYLNDSKECQSEENRFKDIHRKILSAYKTGDSFSLFVLERVLVIMGISRWQNISPIVDAFFSDEFRNNEWFDYCQMSMLYVLYQVARNTQEYNNSLLKIYAAEAADWTGRNKGLFRGRKSNRANPVGMYKRNVMCWYAVVYSSRSGDGIAINGDERPVPHFYELIDKAIDTNDKELLIHLIENISELITDMGYLKTALQLLKHILLRYNTQEGIDKLDAVKLCRGGVYQYNLVRLVGNVLSTAKNYYAKEIDVFIQKEIVGLSFPGISTYREEILNYHPSGEKLSDLLTHKFGNFLMWGLLNVKAIDDFAIEAIQASTQTKDSLAWYKQGVKIFIKHFFDTEL